MIPPGSPGRIFSWISRNRYPVALVLQLSLFAFGHWYDTRIFFGTAGGVGHGQSPYLRPFNLGDYYDSPSLRGTAGGIGYAPPWALFLAAMYWLVYVPTQNVLALNFAMKIPSVFGILLMARFVRKTLLNKGIDSVTAARAELLVLFNPFLIYTGPLWNMFDSLVAFLMLLFLSFLDERKPWHAGIALGLSISFKHLALPLVPLGWLWIARMPVTGTERWRAFSSFTSAMLGVGVVCVLLPFYVFGWPTSGFTAAVTHQTVATGGFTVYNLIPVSLTTPSALSILGYVPFVVAAGLYLSRWKRPLTDFRQLAEFALVILIGFMTTRTFLAEQNLAVIFPLVILPELISGRGFAEANRFWTLFFFYTIWNSLIILFTFLIFPDAFDVAVAMTTSPVVGPIRSAVLFGCALLWLFLGWRYILRRT